MKYVGLNLTKYMSDLNTENNKMLLKDVSKELNK